MIKKLILAVILMIISISAFSQTLYLHAIKSASRITNETCSSWHDSNIPIIWDMDTNHIDICSVIHQSISYTNLIRSIKKDCITFYSNGTDGNLKKVTIDLQMYQKSREMFLIVRYSDITCLYKLELDEDSY